MVEFMLNDTQVYEVRRIEDNAFIQVHYTMRDALKVAAEYEAEYNEPCRVAYSWIDRPETLAQRKANEAA